MSAAPGEEGGLPGVAHIPQVAFRGVHRRLALMRQGVRFWREASTQDPVPPGNFTGVMDGKE